MAKMSIGDKAQRTLRFIMGLRTPGAVNALSKYGFTQADLRRGVEHLNLVAQVRLRPEPKMQEPKLIAALEAFESEWFSVARAALWHAHPLISEWVFAGIGASRGAAVAVAVKAFVDRVEALEAEVHPFGEEGTEARALLVSRGLTAERVAEAKATCAGLATLMVDAEPVSTAERDAAEKAMWSWYLEWSAIARVAIKERYILRALGFRRKPSAEEREAEETQREPSDAPPSDDRPALALPAQASSPDDMRSPSPR